MRKVNFSCQSPHPVEGFADVVLHLLGMLPQEWKELIPGHLTTRLLGPILGAVVDPAPARCDLQYTLNQYGVQRGLNGTIVVTFSRGVFLSDPSPIIGNACQ